MRLPFGTLHDFSKPRDWPLGGHFHGAVLVFSFKAFRLGFFHELTYLLLSDPTVLPYLLELFERDILTLLQGGSVYVPQACSEVGFVAGRKVWMLMRL